MDRQARARVSGERKSVRKVTLICRVWNRGLRRQSESFLYITQTSRVAGWRRFRRHLARRALVQHTGPPGVVSLMAIAPSPVRTIGFRAITSLCDLRHSYYGHDSVTFVQEA